MLTIDDRAGSQHSGSFDFVRQLKRDGVPVRVGRLSFGDFAFTGSGPAGLCRVGVERKTSDEILSSIMDNRFTGHQVPGLLNTYDTAILIVEGRTYPSPEGLLMQDGFAAGRTRSRHLWANYIKFQLTLMFKARLHVWPTRSKPETVQFLHTLYDWYQKPWAQHKSVYTIDETKPEQAILDARTLKRRVAAQLPGVAWSRSKLVDSYFPSLHSMFAADERQWREALGIREGRKAAKTIVQAIRSLDEKV